MHFPGTYDCLEIKENEIFTLVDQLFLMDKFTLLADYFIRIPSFPQTISIT